MSNIIKSRRIFQTPSGGTSYTFLAGTGISVSGTTEITITNTLPSLFTDGGAYTYLTSTTDLFQVGSSTSLGASLGVKGQGSTSATTNLKGVNSSNAVLYDFKDDGTFAIGFNAVAANTTRTAIGYLAKSGSDYCISIGAGAGATSSASNQGVLIGYNTGLVATGAEMVLIGSQVAPVATLSNYTIGIGGNALSTLTTGVENISIGRFGLYGVTTGTNNVHIGGAIQTMGSAASRNTIVGHGAGAIADNGVSVGYYSGRYETASNKLYIDGLDRTNEATGRTNSLIYGVFNATVTSQTLTFNARTAINGRLLTQQGTDVASVAGAIALAGDGNVFEITGTNAITLISNLTWQNGSEVTLIFTSTATLTNGTATSGTDITLKLAGAANFVASADDSITLTLCEIGGVQAWREKCRSVN